MDEYVKRAAIMEFPIRKDHCDKEHANEHFIFGVESVLEYVESLPAADVAPVVHGRWKLLHKGDWTSVFVCSVCGRRETITESESYNSRIKMPRKYPYCHCGARMDGGNDNDR